MGSVVRSFPSIKVNHSPSSIGTKKDILSIVKVSDETLRIRLAEFESTAASTLTLAEFNKLADQTNDFAVNEKGEAVGDDGIMSSHPPAFVRNRLKDREGLHEMGIMGNGLLASEEIGKWRNNEFW